MKVYVHLPGFEVWKGYGFRKLVDSSGAWLFFENTVSKYQDGPWMKHFRTEEEMLKWLGLKLAPVAAYAKEYDPRFLGMAEDMTPRWHWDKKQSCFVKNPDHKESVLFPGGWG